VDENGYLMEPQSPGFPQGPKIKTDRKATPVGSVYDDYTLEGLKNLIKASFAAILSNRAEGGLPGQIQ
jgi:hypothetical protein